MADRRYLAPWETSLTDSPTQDQLIVPQYGLPTPEMPSLPALPSMPSGNDAMNWAAILGGLGLGLARPRVAPQALQSLSAVNAIQARDDAQQHMAAVQAAMKRRQDASTMIAPKLGIDPALAANLDPQDLFHLAATLNKEQPLFQGNITDIANQYGGGAGLPPTLPRGGPPPVAPSTNAAPPSSPLEAPALPQASAAPPAVAQPVSAPSGPPEMPQVAAPSLPQLPPLPPVLQSGQDMTLSQTRGGQTVNIPIKADAAAEQWIAKAQAGSGLARSQAVQALIQRGGVVPQKMAQDAAEESIIFHVAENPQLANPQELVTNTARAFPGANVEKVGQQLFRGTMAKNLDEVQTQKPSGGAQNFIDAYHKTMQSVGPYYTDPKLFDDYQKYLIGKQPTPENVNTMLTQFINTSKEFRTVANSYNEIQRLSEVKGENAAVADIGIVFAYMHLIDPASTVRESEQAQVNNAAGVPVYIRNLWNRLLTGDRLSPTQKSQIVDATDRVFAGQLRNQVRLENDFSGIAKRHGIDSRDITLDFMGPLRSLATGRAATKADFESSLMEAKGNTIQARRLMIEHGINPNLDFIGTVNELHKK